MRSWNCSRICRLPQAPQSQMPSLRCFILARCYGKQAKPSARRCGLFPPHRLRCTREVGQNERHTCCRHRVWWRQEMHVPTRRQRHRHRVPQRRPREMRFLLGKILLRQGLVSAMAGLRQAGQGGGPARVQHSRRAVWSR